MITIYLAKLHKTFADYGAFVMVRYKNYFIK